MSEPSRATIVLALGQTAYSMPLITAIRDDPRFGLEAIHHDFSTLKRELSRRQSPPDLILLSASLGGSDLEDAVTAITQLCPTRVIVLLRRASTLTPVALERAGALHVEHFDFTELEAFSEDRITRLMRTMAAISSVKVLTRSHKRMKTDDFQKARETHSVTQLLRRIEKVSHRAEPNASPPSITEPSFTADTSASRRASSFDLIGIASSTGGLEAVETVIGQLPHSFVTPIVVVQHLASGHDKDFVRELRLHTTLNVITVNGDTQVRRGALYVSPAGLHISVRSGPWLQVSAEPSDVLYCPSADILFESMAKAIGKRGLGVVLTGMGDDGARGLRELKRAGGHTIVQDRESSVIFGMPKAAIDAGAAVEVVRLREIAERLKLLCG